MNCFRITNDRRFRSGFAPDALGPGAPALGIHGSGERRPGHAEESGHQGL